MKQLIFFVLILLPIFIVKPVFAVNCSGLQPAVCTATPTCTWNGVSCVSVIPPLNGAVSSQFATYDPLSGKFSDPSSVINSLLPLLLTAAGLILLGMLIMGGFGMMTAGTDAKKADSGKSRITAAIIGFVIIFISYWIIQILETILGIKILS